MRSKRDPATRYRIDTFQGISVCTCPGWEFYGSCKHTKGVCKVTTDVVVRDKEESVALVPITPTMPTTAIPSIDELNVMKAIAAQAVKAKGMVPSNVDTPEKAFAIMLAGWELGAKPMTALRHIFVVNGKTEPDAQLMMGCVHAGDPNAKFIWHKTNAQGCDVELRRPGRAPVRMAYKISDVKHLAGKAGPWSTYPADMLRWFTLKRVCRLGAPDLINAIEGVGMNINTAESMYDHLPAIEAPEIEGTAIDVTDLHNAGDDPATVPAAAVEAEAAAEEIGAGELEVVEMSREEFNAWCAAQSPAIGPTHLPGLLGMAKDDAEDPFRRHWIEPGMARGLTMDETIAVARNVIAYMWPLCKAARAAGSKTPVRDVSTETNPFSWLEVRAAEKQGGTEPNEEPALEPEGEGERKDEVGAAPEESGSRGEEEGSV